MQRRSRATSRRRWRLHSLTGELRGFHSITVNGNWRMIFRFVGQDVELVDYLDYH
jgi:proteic killer suppression protein